MHPRNDDIWKWTPAMWTPVNLDDDDGGTTATGGRNYALRLERDGKPYYEWSRADFDKLNDFVSCWVSGKKEAPAKKEVNVDAWKEVFATSAAGS